MKNEFVTLFLKKPYCETDLIKSNTRAESHSANGGKLCSTVCLTTAAAANTEAAALAVATALGFYL